jgi:hypothetical protein
MLNTKPKKGNYLDDAKFYEALVKRR